MGESNDKSYAKQVIKKHHRIEKFVPCNIDLYPTIKIENHHLYGRNYKGMAYVGLLSLMEFGKVVGYRVCIWGNDDCGYELDFLSTGGFDRALKLFNSIHIIESESDIKLKWAMHHA